MEPPAWISSGAGCSTSRKSAGVSAPLPTFGLRLGYKISPNWYLRYVSETFFIEIEDTLKGTLLNYELDLEYRVSPRFTVGAGISRISTDLDADDDDWKGGLPIATADSCCSARFTGKRSQLRLDRQQA